MAKTNRRTLKEYFGKGKKPDSGQFADLIDSMLNIVDDGFNKSAERGLQLSPLDDEGAVMEIRRNILDNEPAWIVALGKGGELNIHRGLDEEPSVSLFQDGRIVLGTKDKIELEINGTVRADSFTGNYLKGKVPANGQWQNIGELEYGCMGYQIEAACGLKGKGRYALAEATAIHCFGKHPSIRSSHSWFGSRFNRIQFRWYSEGLNCRLQVRTRSDYGEDVWVYYCIKRLFDMDFVSR
ncbi:hypothetical protein [uncultured Bacteroides sp.]|uniref:hypothetical protein n=1 Tax=uncultured Bacteroides sp. TaxID=162156 RepID=UPI0025FBBF25|nr:hypothetical protein [uncultured Bacteroides sp.]